MWFALQLCPKLGRWNLVQRLGQDDTTTAEKWDPGSNLYKLSAG